MHLGPRSFRPGAAWEAPGQSPSTFQFFSDTMKSRSQAVMIGEPYAGRGLRFAHDEFFPSLVIVLHVDSSNHEKQIQLNQLIA